MGQIEDAAEVITLAVAIVALKKRAQAVKDAGDSYQDPEADIRIPMSNADQDVNFKDKMAAKWQRIKTIAAGY
jgi:hypothetical protein